MFKTIAMIHSLKDFAEVTILHESGVNDVVAEYKGVRYTGDIQRLCMFLLCGRYLWKATRPAPLS